MAFNILIVDDSAVMRQIIIKTLRLSGLELREIYQAGNGEEGLLMLDQHWIDFALIDINMPVLDGQEMIQRVRANQETQQLPIIVISTEGSETRIDELLHHGVKFIHKPFDPTVLGAMIKGMTGVSDEHEFTDCTLPGNSPDF